jgi:hypothetical protein
MRGWADGQAVVVHDWLVGASCMLWKPRAHNNLTLYIWGFQMVEKVLADHPCDLVGPYLTAHPYPTPVYLVKPSHVCQSNL